MLWMWTHTIVDFDSGAASGRVVSDLSCNAAHIVFDASGPTEMVAYKKKEGLDTMIELLRTSGGRPNAEDIAAGCGAHGAGDNIRFPAFRLKNWKT